MQAKNLCKKLAAKNLCLLTDANRVELYIWKKPQLIWPISEPVWGQLSVANELKKQCIIVSLQVVLDSSWLSNELNNFKQRPKALEARSTQDGILLMESHFAALGKLGKARSSR